MMTAEMLDTPISYEQLEDLEDDFEEVELELRKSSLSPRSSNPGSMGINISMLETNPL